VSTPSSSPKLTFVTVVVLSAEEAGEESLALAGFRQLHRRVGEREKVQKRPKAASKMRVRVAN
jgi:hypothetical protein